MKILAIEGCLYPCLAAVVVAVEADQAVEPWAAWFAALEADGVDRGPLEAVAEVESVWVDRAAPGLDFVEEWDARDASGLALV